MRISRAIGRVKRQAKQGGLNAMMAGLGEGLRSSAVPRPFRGAACRTAELLGPQRPASRRGKEPGHTSAASSHAVGAVTPPSKVTITGIDSGIEPNDQPRDGTPVDPAAVGSTPIYDATPVEVAPVEVTAIDATPTEVAPVEVAPIDVAPGAATSPEGPVVERAPTNTPDHGTHAKTAAAHVQGRDAGGAADTAEVAVSSGGDGSAGPTSKAEPGRNGGSKKRAVPSGDTQGEKEKLAADGEAAKTLARSGSKGAKKRSGSRADRSSKKK